MKELAAIIKIKKIAEEVKPDIMHLHRNKPSVIGRIAFNSKDIPLLYTPLGYSFLMQNYKPAKKILFKLIEAVSAKINCLTINCNLGEQRKTLKLTKHAVYVNSTVNSEQLQKIIDKSKINKHSFNVFTLGRIYCRKNLMLFNQAAKVLPDIRLLWIDEGRLRDKLKTLNL